MLLPPPPDGEVDEKRSEAVFIETRLIEERGTWKRITTYWHDGEDYQYALEALPMNQFPGGPHYPAVTTEAEARRKLFGPKVDEELARAFLREVALDMTRPH